LSPRRLFVGSISILAGFAANITAWPILSQQADWLSDVIKLFVLIVLATAFLSACLWTAGARITKSPRERRLAGALAGALTAIIIVPLPFFGWAMKQGLIGLLAESQLSLTTGFNLFTSSIWHGLLAFVQFTKASLGAIGLSAGLGYAISRYGADETAGSRQTP
jgi:hypothetical protein